MEMCGIRFSIDTIYFLLLDVLVSSNTDVFLSSCCTAPALLHLHDAQGSLVPWISLRVRSVDPAPLFDNCFCVICVFYLE